MFVRGCEQCFGRSTCIVSTKRKRRKSSGAARAAKEAIYLALGRIHTSGLSPVTMFPGSTPDYCLQITILPSSSCYFSLPPPLFLPRAKAKRILHQYKTPTLLMSPPPNTPLAPATTIPVMGRAATELPCLSALNLIGTNRTAVVASALKALEERVAGIRLRETIAGAPAPVAAGAA